MTRANMMNGNKQCTFCGFEMFAHLMASSVRRRKPILKCPTTADEEPSAELTAGFGLPEDFPK